MLSYSVERDRWYTIKIAYFFIPAFKQIIQSLSGAGEKGE